MASETLDEKKQEDIANVEVKEEEKAEEEREEETKEEEERVGDTEMVEKEGEAIEENGEEKETTEEKGEESKDQAEEENKKAKRWRKETAKKVSKDEKRDEPSSKEAVTPTSERPTRERKIVERYSEPSPGRSASKGLSIEKGRGTQLKDIPNVAFKLAKRKPDDNLQILHTILYGKKSKSHSLKRNIGQFSGYVWVENEEKHKAKIKEKLDKCVKEKLVDFCHVFDISVNKAIVRKEELSAKLLEFLQSPHATTDTLLSDKEQKGKKRKGKTTASSGEASGEVPAKKRKKILQTGERRKRSSKTEEDLVDDKAEPSGSKNESEDEDGNENDSIPKEESDREGSKSEEEQEIDEDEPMEEASVEMKSSKKNVKKDSGSKVTEKSKSVKKEGTPAKSVKTPTKSPKKSSISSSKKGTSSTDGASGSMPNAKVSASKKHKVEKGQKDQNAAAKEKGKNGKQSSKSTSNVSTKDKGKRKASKKAKPEPTKEELHAVVVDILNEVDFNTATLADILRQLGTHFDVDLKDRELEVKGIITDVIKNMPDDEDEGDGTESGDDAEKD